MSFRDLNLVNHFVYVYGSFRRRLFLFFLFYHFSSSCFKCNKYYWDIEKLTEHVRNHKTLQNQGDLPLLCDVCGRTYESETLLRTHLNIHLRAEEKPTFECFMCQKRFAMKMSLVTHMTQHSANEVEKHQCNICKRWCARKDTLKRHILTHTDVCSFQCSYCEKKFKFKNRLQVCIFVSYYQTSASV